MKIDCNALMANELYNKSLKHVNGSISLYYFIVNILISPEVSFIGLVIVR